MFKKGNQFAKGNPPNKNSFKKGHKTWNKKDKIIKICQICGKEFQVRPYRENTAKFCSCECQNKSLEGKDAWNRGTKGIMKANKTSFKKGIIPWNFGKECPKGEKAANWKGGKIKVICQQCGKEFWVFPSKIKVGDGKFCSRSCLTISNSLNSSKENHWNWKGGITPENIKVRQSLKMKEWRRAVYKRDDFTCQKYKIKGGKLNPHHILNFSEYTELRFEIDNGITLSEKAHKEFHKKYGIKNNTIEQINEFLIS